MITRDVYVTRRKRVEPISVVYGSDAVSIRLRVADFIIPSGAEAVANVVSLGRATAYQTQCTVEGGAISFTPPVGFFRPGVNRMQVDVTMAGKHLITFVLDVHCESNLVADMDTTTPEAVRPMVERAEAAASNAEASATSASNAASNAEASATSASNAASNAEASATSASNAASNAEASASSASNAASNAEASATSASNAASNAEASASSASNAASNAEASASSASNAASNAEAAATSASNAATRAEQAADSIRFSTNETLTLSSEKVLSVNTADSAVSGSGLPITSGAVHSIVGNVEAILQSI